MTLSALVVWMHMMEMMMPVKTKPWKYVLTFMLQLESVKRFTDSPVELTHTMRMETKLPMKTLYVNSSPVFTVEPTARTVRSLSEDPKLTPLVDHPQLEDK